MAAQDDLTVINGLLKQVYDKDLAMAIPDQTLPIFKAFPFSNAQRIGDHFVSAVNLSLEQGVTRSSDTAGVVVLNAPISSVVKQAQVSAAVITMQANLSWDAVAKTKAVGTAAVKDAMSVVILNCLQSHRHHQAIDMLYGGVELAVINATTSSTVQPITKSSTAPGLWYNLQNATFDIWDPTYTTKRNGSPLSLSSCSVDASGSSRTLTFGASVSTTAGDFVQFSGTVTSNAVTTPVGLESIGRTQGGTLFNLSQATYPVFQAPQYDVGNGALTRFKVDRAANLALTRGYTSKMILFVNPATMGDLLEEETSRIMLTGGQTTGTSKIGYNSLTMYSTSGATIECVSNVLIKEGVAFLVPDDGSVKRIGSVDVALGAPGDPYPQWQRIPGSSGYGLISYSMQAMYTANPWKVVYIKNIVNQS